VVHAVEDGTLRGSQPSHVDTRGINVEGHYWFFACDIRHLSPGAPMTLQQLGPPDGEAATDCARESPGPDF
jgi:hypothetical protein